MMNPITRRRWRSFFSQTRSWIGLSIFLFLMVAAFGAEIWSSQKPLWMNRDGKTYFPAWVQYSAKEFGIEDSFEVDFPAVIEKDLAEGKQTKAVWALNRWDPYIQSPDTLAPPSLTHWLGTDNLGRDITARLIYGMRVSFLFGFAYWFLTFLIGIIIGAIQGFYGGHIDFFTERAKELVEILPFLSLIIIINGLVEGGGFMLTLGIVVILSWVGISAQMRAQFLSLRKRDFCEAALALGGSPSRVMFKHILPNALTPILSITPFSISAGISLLLILDYLGFGLDPPTPSLGELLAQGRSYIQTHPWVLISPTVALILMLVSINLIGEALRQAFDPRKG